MERVTKGLLNDMEDSRNEAQKYYRKNDYLQSIESAKKWLSFSKNKGDKKEEAAAYDILANSNYKVGNYKESIESGNHELKIATEAGDKELEAQAHSILSSSYYRVDNYKQSIEHCNEILRIAKEIDQRKWDVEAYCNLASSSYMLQNGVKDPDYKESIENGELLLEAAKTSGNREGEVAAYYILSNSYTKRGDKKKADEYLQLAAGGSSNYSPATRPTITTPQRPVTAPVTKAELSTRTSQNQAPVTNAPLPARTSQKPVPSEIEARGPGAKVASENDIKTGKVKLYRARIILIGQDQAGKTSLKKSLFGLPFESKEENTEGIKVDPTVFEVDVKQVKNWPLSDDARIAAKEVNEEEPKEGPTREEKMESATVELKINPALSPEEVTDDVLGVNLQSDGTSVENHATLDVWDFAGQHLYYAFYPVFLSPRAVYLLICNLSNDLKATAPPCVRKTVFGNKDQNENETNLENLLSWLTSVSTLCCTETDVTKKLDYLRPPIFIVGTHSDKPHQDIKEMEEQIQKEIFGKKFSKHVIRPAFFTVDNTQGSSGEGLAELQKRMNEVLTEEPYMGEEVPLR